MTTRTGCAAVVTTYNRPDALGALIASIPRWTLRPDVVLVVNNGAPICKPSPDWVILDEPGGNIGLPGAIRRAFERLADHDAILVLDDDTLLRPDALEAMLATGSDVVSVPDRFTIDWQGRVGGVTRIFPWSPTVIRARARRLAEPPRPELFFAWDDWEYAVRLSRAGAEIAWLEDSLIERHSLHSWFPGRAYLSARNIAYIWVRLANRDRLFGALLREQLVKAAHRRSGYTRWGLRDGLLGRMGAPPPGILPAGAAVPAPER